MSPPQSDPGSRLCPVLTPGIPAACRTLPVEPHDPPQDSPPGCSSQLCCLAAPLSHLAPGRPPLGDKVVTMARVHGALVTCRLLSHPGMRPPRALQTPAGHAEQLRPEHAGLREERLARNPHARPLSPPSRARSGLSGPLLEAGMAGLGTPRSVRAVTRGHQLTLHDRASPLFLM